MKNILLTCCLVLLASPASIKAQGQSQVDASKIEIVYQPKGAGSARVSAGRTFRSGDRELKFDIYAPRKRAGKKTAIVFVSGTSESRDWRWFQSYGQAAAALDFVAFVPDKRLPYTLQGTETGTADTIAFVAHLRANANELGINPDRICIWTFSGAGRLTALPYRPEGTGIACHVSYYGVMTVGDQVAADAPDRDALISRYSANVAVRESGARKVPTFLVRAGRDNPALNGTIDSFVQSAVQAGLPLTFVNYPDGQHGFDGLDRNEQSSRIVEESFRFIRNATSLDSLDRSR